MCLHFLCTIALLGFSLISPEMVSAQEMPTALPGMPPVEDPKNIYSSAGANMFSPAVKDALARVYVPNSHDNTVSVIDPKTYQVIETLKTGQDPQHIVPAYDLKMLYVLNDNGSSILPINPDTGKPGALISVDRPYNLYFTPDGRFAIAVNDVQKRLDFRDPHTFELIESVPVQCKGVNHMDFTADGLYAIASCEYSGVLLKLDISARQVMGYLNLKPEKPNKSPMPQDVRLSPDGKTFFVADMMMDGVYLIDPVNFQQIGFIKTGKGTHSLYPSRDGKFFYVSNRGCNLLKDCPKKGPGSIAVVDPVKKQVIQQWAIPGGGSPDMGNVNADGSELWLSGRYDNEVYVFNTGQGKLTHRIPVGQMPHGLCVWPEPGRYSLGHTGNIR